MNKNALIKLLATGFGLGFSPFAPGTAGTLAAIPIFILMSSLPIYSYMGLTILFVVTAVFICELAERIFETHDSKQIVIDEIVGFLVAMVWVPFTWVNIAIGFVLFRLFDAIKPWPISHLDKKIKGGFGVVCDDVAAGIATSIILQFLMSKGWL